MKSRPYLIGNWPSQSYLHNFVWAKKESVQIINNNKSFICLYDNVLNQNLKKT